MLVALLAGTAEMARPEEPVTVSLCRLDADPAFFNHKLVKVTAFLSHGFEDFSLFDPECHSRTAVWLEYGGTASSNTVYCCGVTASRSRPKTLVVEDIPIPLVDDARFRTLDRLLQRQPDSFAHATIVGRFFAGEVSRRPGNTGLRGYGHLGCCSLLVIQQVLLVDPQDRKDLDYRSSADQPELAGPLSSFCRLMSIEDLGALLEFQRRAESGERAWAFDEPRRVACDSLAKFARVEGIPTARLKQLRKAPGRVVYTWRSGRGPVSYLVVVSRPYWLSFYARNPGRVAWVAIAAYELEK
jgi:hypothetical protein